MKIKTQLLFSVFFFSLLLLIVSGCNKNETRIRINNVDPISELSKVQIGPTYFGYVKNKELTGYKGITERTHEVTYTWGNTDMQGEITIDNPGKYTLFMTNLTVQLQKD